MPSLGTLALRRTNTPSSSNATPSPITIPKRVWPRRTPTREPATPTFSYDPRPSSSSTSSSSTPKSLKSSSSLSSLASTSSTGQTMNNKIRTTVVDLPASASKRREEAPSPGGYDSWGGFVFDGAHISPKGFYVQSIDEFLGESSNVRGKR